MDRFWRIAPAAWSICLWTAIAGSASAVEETKSSGLGDPGPLTELRVEPNIDGKGFVINGRDRSQQLFVTGLFASGQQHDFTRKVTYKAEPEGIVSISDDGYVTPLADGTVTITASIEAGKSASLSGTVAGIANDPPMNFKNQIVPIFTKLGCNSGGCHGKASGQNGFKLSLLGFYPDDDYEFLVKEGRGRRLNPASPDESLFLTKPVGKSPHGGGKRMEEDSHEYRLIAHWIEQGMPYGNPEDPVVTSIQCLPTGRVMDRGAEQQITVVATYSDGSTEDVTRMALFEPNDTEMAESGKTGLVRSLDLSGEVAIMARYQGQVSTFRATIPLGADLADIPEPNNFVDEAVMNKLKLLGIPPSGPANDATFIRRAYVDITGEIPTAEEVRQFLADSDPEKRDKLIDRLVDSPGYADLFANKWNMVLRNKRRGATDQKGTYAFYRWIWNSLYENKPYDQFAREILTASGDMDQNPPVVWYREVSKNNEQVEDTAQLFLGLRIQCARCHHHPFERWSQNDYYSLSAFFSRVGNKKLANDASAARDRRIFHNEGVATAKNPRNGTKLKPAGLGVEAFDIPADRDPRHYLVDWMAAKDNPFFAKAIVNRYWKHFFDRGIVEPEDDMRETNPPSNPELLDNLAQQFIENNFDLKWLVRTICKSNTYQLSAIPNDYNLKDKQNFSRYYPRRLKAEVLYDALHQVTSTSQAYKGLPAGTSALQLPDPSVGTYFLKVFGQPQGETACECERSQEANLAQSLHLLNSSEVQGKISNASGRAAILAKDTETSDEQKIQELYLSVYSRAPQDDELKIALAHIAKHEKEKQIAYEDIIWALVNTKEFLFNH
ncbi:Bacterial Ig-like domain (group 2) [Symmachiella dynata]|uniref:Bacterial Ig-like domain (Group 2) n=1 Tax=Symmachiella dynata TaxID=2527995 RepID=A0A517ZNV5_9PLAN|nr:DUF1549 domain-containing protein [Symmachiella dynata]QDU44156.1 Bacterial Ig-like domain (group 2) [Symmachiella dynata]